MFDIDSPAGTDVDGDAARIMIRKGSVHRELTINLLRQMAKMHGRSFMAEVYAALGSASSAPSLTPAQRVAVQEAERELFRIEGTQSHHREQGRGFRFGNEVTLVRADFDVAPCLEKFSLD